MAPRRRTPLLKNRPRPQELFRQGLLLAVLGLVALAVVPRVIFLSRWQDNFDSDEALVGVQASELLRGHFSLFLPGQSYMGSLQGLLAAPWVAFLGHHATAVRLSPLLWIVPGWLALAALERPYRIQLDSPRT
jgi:hypothetical protein